MQQDTPYTFGDTVPAGRRLALLAEVYAGSTRDFLRRWAPSRPSCAVDLGCGPGHTTALLHRVARPGRTTGIDNSPAFLEQARATATAGIDHVQADVTAPLPVRAADVVHARFLLTHLTGHERVLGLWADALAPGGRLLLQEVASMGSASPEFDRYYSMVRGMQRHHGQEMYVGTRLGDAARAAGLTVVHHGLRRLVLPAPGMARLHLMNLCHWRCGEFARDHLDPGELDRLQAWLRAVAEGAQEAGPVVQELGELVAERAGMPR